MRYQTIRSESRDWLIVDTRGNPPRVICTCSGWHRDNADFICDALNSYDKQLNKIIEEANVSVTGSKSH